MQSKSLTVLAMAIVLGACGPGERMGDDTGDDDDTPGFIDASPIDEFTPDAGATEQCTKIDFVFVVDDSGSMAEEQANLATNFPMFINVIEQYMTMSGQQLDYRVAVTTTGRTVTSTTTIVGSPIPPIMMTEQGDNGAFRLDNNCGMTRRWFERADGNVAQNFGCAAEVGTGGPSYEMPLQCTKLALSDRVNDGTNANFLRDDALLAVVILTDEDDCSRLDDNLTTTLDLNGLAVDDPCSYGHAGLETPASYIQFLDTLKGARGRWAVAVIAGQTQCTTNLGDAAEAKRLKDFVQMSGTNATFGNICDGNLTAALQQALTTFTAACDNFPPIE
jgi:hypothetical protein